MTAPVIVWFRRDLRLADNPALAAAAAAGQPVIPVYILDEEAPGPWRPGGASRWWLYHSLRSLSERLVAAGGGLVLRRGPAGPVLRDLLAETGAGAVVWNRLYDPWAVRRDTAIKADLASQGIAVGSHGGALLFEPSGIKSRNGKPFRVFTPFWRTCLAAPPPDRPLAAPVRLRKAALPTAERLEDWRLLPTRPDWAGGLRATWEPGEPSGLRRLTAFVDDALRRYGEERNRPDHAGTSRLSPHLHFGEISVRQVWHAASTAPPELAGPFLRQIGWREFCHHLLHHIPSMPDEPLDRRFAGFAWHDEETSLSAWRRGSTGYPIVDAGMRELWETGWMHNRVRMIVASFLTKHLLVPWQSGERWFWDTLVDADLANNAAGWQWVAGCGADAAPYFRIFNPVLQGQRFDPDGDYVRRFVPEIAGLPAAVIHRPWQASETVLADAGVRLDQSYPRPLVEHAAARRRALQAFERSRGAAGHEAG
ncbi:MAG: deoxyribodipyrimidine photo-lyase [Xanthobacteraceae bacterium]